MSARKFPHSILAACALVACAAVAPAIGATSSTSTTAQPTAPSRAPAFDVIALGTSGGIVEDDLTAYLIGRAGRAQYVLADAGTLVAGLRKAEALGSLDDVPPSAGGSRAARVLSERIGTILISHPHLDHVGGLVIASPDDDKHFLFALPSTIDVLKSDIFNNRTWVNFLSEGERPLSKYMVTRMQPGSALGDERAGLLITAYPLSHAGMTSTAFLIQGKDDEAALYLGDTGPDSVEKQGMLHAVWQRVAPLVRLGKLRVVIVEVSYPNGRADKLLFGHLTPDHLQTELAALARIADPTNKKILENLPVVISHVKPTVSDSTTARQQIARELEASNTLGIRFVHLRQGGRASF